MMEFFEADGIEFVVNVVFDVGADVSTLIGSLATVVAKRGQATSITGIATILNDTQILCKITVPSGPYNIQVRVIPPIINHLGKTVGEYPVIVVPTL